MKIAISFSQFSLLSLLFFSSFSWAAASLSQEKNFLQCLTKYSHDSAAISQVIYTPQNSSYTSNLLYSINNLRFAKPETPKPQVIVTPVNPSQVQTVIYCSKNHGMQIRIRGGGHSFEGLSYVAHVPFVLLDMKFFRSVDVDLKTETAWVGAGVTNGELYYYIGKASNTLGFPSGLWSNVGVAGLIAGGGYGMMRRKYGLAADNTIDALLVDVNGRILDRKSMGEDLFWAIRGGGGGNFGVILSWKVKLVPVPKTVTVFRVGRTLEQNVTTTFYRYQAVAPEFPKELDIRCNGQSIVSDASPRADKRTTQMTFESLYLGGVDGMLSVVHERFPELGLVRDDCLEVSWLQAMLFFSNFPVNAPPEILLNRTILPRLAFKGRTDFTKVPIPVQGLQGMWDMMFKIAPQAVTLQFTPFGGRMSEISESALPYPYRAGTWFMFHMFVQTEVEEAQRMEWLRGFAEYLTPYVNKTPRSAYVNYVNLWLGKNKLHGKTSYERASKWGKCYYNNNFDRLVQVKTTVDPHNFFRHEQSIPTL